MNCWPLGVNIPNHIIADIEESKDEKPNQTELSKKNYMRFKDKINKVLKPLFIDELVELVPEWLRLQEVRDNAVELHSLLVLYLTWVDVRMSGLSKKH